MTPKPFAVFDIDGTLIRWQMFHAVVDQLALNKHLNTLAYDKARKARTRWKNRQGAESFDDYNMKLVKALLQAITNIDPEDYDQAVLAAFKKHKDQTYQYTRDLIKTLKDKGYLLFALSGSMHEVVELVADYYGFDECVGTEYIRAGGSFTGEITLTKDTKDVVLRELVEKHASTFEGSIGVADSEGDIGMLDIVENPIAFNPSKKLFRRARVKGWKVVLERKNMIYELERKGDGRTYELSRTNA